MRHGDMVKADKITDKMPLTKAAQSSRRQRKLSTATATPGKRAAPPDIGHNAASGEAASAKKLQKEGAARMRGGDDDNGGGEARAGMPAGAGDHGPVADEPVVRGRGRRAVSGRLCGIRQRSCKEGAARMRRATTRGEGSGRRRRRGGKRTGGHGGGGISAKDHGHEGQLRRGVVKIPGFATETKYVPAYFTLTKFVGRFESGSGRSKVRGTA